MARFLVLPGSVAVASDRLVQILGLNVDGSIEARDLANGSTFNWDPSLLKAAPRARHGQAGAAQRIDVAVDNDWETARRYCGQFQSKVTSAAKWPTLLRI